ncbi:hypothetical protein ASG01_08900 [Chryseobacterium sp. Leaf180]|uniref:terminase small subunit-like protein n=1 Tax=Chryseobacterium sp. Leaf180 TaxID=1736289 RepID=UPI0006F85240|nr:hypothetical protein [Chryseobacterium sp. Leaf180]KQR93305.1 hypothetical protein ASG01_08900 [Chryseobacterium sp. Leaf180]
MAYSPEEIEKKFDSILDAIEEGKSLRKTLKEIGPSSKTFYEWLDADAEKIKRYARACEDRAEALLDEMLDIVDDTSCDYVGMDIGEGEASEIVLDKKPNYELIQRSRLRYDARKWLVSKLNPKKYGDKLDVTTDGQKLNNTSIPLVMPDGKTYEDLKNELKPEEEE